MIDFKLGVTLRPLDYNLTPQLWRNDPRIWRWTRQNDLISEQHHQSWYQRQNSDPSIKMYGIWKDQTLVGVCGLTSIDYQNRRAEFSLYIGPEHQRNGLSKPALQTLFYHGFKNVGLNLIWGETFADNRAQNIFRGIGMEQDGIRRQFYWKDGGFCDAILFSITSREFLSRHGERSCFT